MSERDIRTGAGPPADEGVCDEQAGLHHRAGLQEHRLHRKAEAGPLTVLIGPNGSGKTNFVGVFSFLNALREGRLREYVIKAGGADKVLHFGSQVTETLHIHIAFRNEVYQDEENQYEVTLEPNGADELVPVSEFVRFWDRGHYSRPLEHEIRATSSREAGISMPDLQQTAHSVQRRLASWRLYHFHDTSAPSPLKKTADVHDNRLLRPDGANLAPFLYLLREQHEDSYRLIVHTVRQVAPFFRDFVLEPQRLNPDKIRLEWKHEGTDAYFDSSSLSDGTLRFMALATLFLQPKQYKPSVIVVDEPELGMHPYAITLLASLMKQASTDSQVIVSTQSSLLLDNFEPEEVMVADRVKGATEFTPLESSRLESWLENYSLGQLWEKNELGGRPAPE